MYVGVYPSTNSYLVLDSYSAYLFFFVNIILAIQEPLLFYINLRISLPISAKNLAEIFIGIALNPRTNWGEIASYYVELTNPLT